MRLALLGVAMLAGILTAACDSAPSDATNATPSATLASAATPDMSPTVARTAPSTFPPTVPPTVPASTATRSTPPAAPPGQVECSTLEESWRSAGLVRLTISPSAPRPGDRVTVTGSGIRAPGLWDLNVSDLDEVEIKVGSVDVGEDRLINGTFVMPSLGAIYSGNPFGRCIAVTIRGATDSGQRFISQMFPRP